MNDRAVDTARYTGKPIGTKPPDRPCRYCGRPIIWLLSPDRQWQPCDPAIQLLIGEDGAPVKGHTSHWATCPKAIEARRGAEERKKRVDAQERVAPRVAASAPPAPSAAPAPQLSLLAKPDDTLRAGAVALANATTVGHYDPTIRSSIIAAALAKDHVLEIDIPGVTGHAGAKRTEADWSRDMERLRSLRNLTVEDQDSSTNQQRVFLIVGEDQRKIQGHVRQGTSVRLKLHPAVVARFLGAAVIPPAAPTDREPGEDVE